MMEVSRPFERHVSGNARNTIDTCLRFAGQLPRPAHGTHFLLDSLIPLC